ncbi:conserved Plasmodium protein, unknown function [Plasmodium gallinaceum]|uniref:Pinin/SDK/MemA protein domain-containing protein n=1 Tax=Plasmodium gallinaceum TaxID=5849 RepID=A0A1J1GZ75_PLAGA|nr:conserved Plasmodium protein, unknown function [Plasmodium gallinaceum]CRG97537.1 conserved Plasmodium protein, unknown function [Plasmodium gallinaceum]
MKSYLLEEDKLKASIKKCYFERDIIKSKIVNYLNRLTYLSSDERDDNKYKTKQKRIDSSEFLDNLPDFKIEKRPKLEEDESTLTRNKRLLQIGLFDHLKKAKDALEQEKNNKTVILQHLQNKRVEEKILEEKKNFEKSELEDMEKKITTYIKDLKRIEKNIKHDEGKLMKLNLINHYDKMKNFISTNTYPTIFWCPLKFNEKTKILQKNTENFIKKKISAIKSTNYEVNFKEENWLEQFLELKKKVEKKNKTSDNEFKNNNENEKEKNDINENENNKECKNENSFTEEVKQNIDGNSNKEYELNNDKKEKNSFEDEYVTKVIDNDYCNTNTKENSNEKVGKNLKKNSHEEINKREKEDSNENLKENLKNTVEDNSNEDLKENLKNTVEDNSNEDLKENPKNTVKEDSYEDVIENIEKKI